jgi:transcriptional regulator
MYTPKQFALEDAEKIVSFMQAYSFATLVTVRDGLPVATHLPFVVELREGSVILTSHMAKANPQWKDLAEQQALVIFTEPHAYISPSLYEHERNVPTWNYVAVHAYGQAVLQTEDHQALTILEAMMDSFEPAYKQQWDGLPEDYRLKLLKGIVAFRISVTDLQGKHKVSQNKTEAERQRIIESLSRGNDQERAIGEWMREQMTDGG